MLHRARLRSWVRELESATLAAKQPSLESHGLQSMCAWPGFVVKSLSLIAGGHHACDWVFTVSGEIQVSLKEISPMRRRSAVGLHRPRRGKAGAT